MSSRLVLVSTKSFAGGVGVWNTAPRLPCNWGRSYHLSATLGAGQEWRKARGLAKNPNSYGPLTDGPDYSFLDGRPTPPGSGKIKRAEKHLAISKKIIELSKEVDFAVDYRKERDAADEARKENILQRKLKPKGKEIEE